jgi:hypothetical protein
MLACAGLARMEIAVNGSRAHPVVTQSVPFLPAHGQFGTGADLTDSKALTALQAVDILRQVQSLRRGCLAEEVRDGCCT